MLISCVAVVFCLCSDPPPPSLPLSCPVLYDNKQQRDTHSSISPSDLTPQYHMDLGLGSNGA